MQDWRSLAAIDDPAQRLTRALQAAAQRHGALPEAERVYAPNEAIQLLVHYVAISIALGARMFDSRLLLSLPELLEPFASLSPLLGAMWQNALATREASCHRQQMRARVRWLACFEHLGKLSAGDQKLLESIRYAVAFGVGMGDAQLGLSSAVRWADVLDRDPLQRVNAMYLRKIVCLSEGDLEGAERCRKQAELLALQANAPQMFTNLLAVELVVHTSAWDLTGVRQIAARIAPLASRHEGWRAFNLLAEAHYQRLRGDLQAAKHAYEQCLALATPDASQPTRSIAAWLSAAGSYAELLVSLNRASDAKAFAEGVLQECRTRDLETESSDVARSLALAEARLGKHESAAARLDALIERQRSIGVAGLVLGASYEARARIGIWSGDRASVERYAALTAEQYRHGHGSPLGARYERLMDEARTAGVVVLPSLSPFESSMFGSAELGARGAAQAAVARAMEGATDRDARARTALSLVCESLGARAGHLFLATRAGLQLAASHAAQRPDDLLELRVRQLWAAQGDDLDVDTASAVELTRAPETWADRGGAAYRPILLSATIDGETTHAGVVLLAVEPGDDARAPDLKLLSELTQFLVRMGDSGVG